jgi:hypothetical protein
MTMNLEHYAVLALTIGVVILNSVVAVRAMMLAMDIESGHKWVCKTIRKHCVIRMLQGITTLCLILAILKGWSVLDVFVNYWDQMPHTYHIRSFAYLGENYGVAIVGYAMITVINEMTRCTTSIKYSRLVERWDGKKRRKTDNGVLIAAEDIENVKGCASK